MLTPSFLFGVWPKNGTPVRLIRTAAFPLLIKVSTELRAEPIKAKKKIDPNIIRAREEKRRKKFEKMIQKHLKAERQLKPVEENSMPDTSLIEERKRTVKIPENVETYRRLILKEWAKVRHLESVSDLKLLERITCAQKKALDELKLESKELYDAAVQIDEKLIPLQYSGPTETPPIKQFPIMDGEYIDISKKWL